MRLALAAACVAGGCGGSCEGPQPGATEVVVAFGSRGEGEIEPCGCPEEPLGGLARRNTVIAERRAAGPLVVVDAGLSLAPPELDASPRGLEQRRLKADLIARAWAMGGIDGVALGSADWALGAAFVRGLVDEHHLPVLAANLVCDGVAPWPGGRVVEVGGRRIGLVGVTDGVVERCEVGPPVPALRAAVEALGPVDVVVALLPYGTDRGLAAALAEATPTSLAVDIAVDARGRTARAGAERRGDTFFVDAGSQQHSVSLLTLRFTGGRRWMPVGEGESVTRQLERTEAQVTSLDERIAREPSEVNRATLQAQRDAYQRRLEELRARAADAGDPGASRFAVSEVELDDRIADHPEVAAALAETKKAITALAGGEGVAAFVPRRVADPASAYAGGEACVECHAAEHAQWSTTAHARAWQGLRAVDRAMDDDCWSCHVTGAAGVSSPSGSPGPGGPASPESAAGFHDVQCEACHGPGRAHAAAPQENPLVADPPEGVCRSCHDGVRDQGRFDFATYRPKVVHGPATPAGR